MRTAWAVVACVLAPGLAAASPAREAVIGGADAKAGKWPDVVAILYPSPGSDDALCSGTLVAPTIVLTAGHCFEDGFEPDHVLVGASSLAKPDDGELIEVADGFVFPDPEATEDLTVLVLATPSSHAPRAIATGWARVDITNGAPVALVGFGAIDEDGTEFVDELQEASATITDADCTRSVGCNLAARPAGELGAGGGGIDTCPGDSGGPLYLTTDYGAFLAGVTSRSYDDAELVCSEGGIYVRPDKLIGWIEQVAGTSVARGPEPTAAPIELVPGGDGDSKIVVNDPRSKSHRLEITTPPAHGQAKVRGDGALRVCAAADAPTGDDAVTVTITDTKHAGRALSIVVPIAIAAGTAAGPCDLDDFASDGGCCDAGGASGGALPLGLAVLGLVRRRRVGRT